MQSERAQPVVEPTSLATLGDPRHTVTVGQASPDDGDNTTTLDRPRNNRPYDYVRIGAGAGAL